VKIKEQGRETQRAGLNITQHREALKEINDVRGIEVTSAVNETKNTF
jgi:hypothetical protein